MNLYRLLLLGLLVGNVLLRFFTNYFSVLPRILNVWDLIATMLLAGLALTGPRTPGLNFDTGRLFRRLLLFDVVGIAGSLLNSDHVHPLPVLSQLLMWNQPIILFLAVVSLPFSISDINKFKRLLIFLICFEIAIGIAQAPFYFSKTHDSETICGTFPGNAEQYQYFILLGLYFLLAELQLRQFKRHRLFAAIFLILVLVVLIDNKASWGALAITLTIVVTRLPEVRGELSGKFKTYAFLATLLTLGYTGVKLASSTSTAKFGGIAEAFRTGNIMKLGKIKAMRDVLSSYGNNLHMAFVGSGLGTFYSRAAFQYFPFRIKEIYSSESAAEVVGGVESRQSQSASMAGLINPIVGTKAFYKSFYDHEKIFAIGSGTADFPTSSYISLLGETGLVGTFLYLGFYGFALRTARSIMRITASDSLFFPFSAATYAGLIYLLGMGSYNFWLESGRVNTIIWCMLALSVRYAALNAEVLESAPATGESESDAAAQPHPQEPASVY